MEHNNHLGDDNKDVDHVDDGDVDDGVLDAVG